MMIMTNGNKHILSKLFLPILILLIFVVYLESVYANPIVRPAYYMEMRKEELTFELESNITNIIGEYHFSSLNLKIGKSRNFDVVLLLPIYVDKYENNRIDNELKVTFNKKNITTQPVDGKGFRHKFEFSTPQYCAVQWYQIPLGNSLSLKERKNVPITIKYKQKLFKFGRYKYFTYTPLFSYFLRKDEELVEYSSDLDEFNVTINNNFRNLIELKMGPNNFKDFKTITFSLQKPKIRDIKPIEIKIKDLSGYSEIKKPLSYVSSLKKTHVQPLKKQGNLQHSSTIKDSDKLSQNSSLVQNAKPPKLIKKDEQCIPRPKDIIKISNNKQKEFDIYPPVLKMSAGYTKYGRSLIYCDEKDN